MLNCQLIGSTAALFYTAYAANTTAGCVKHQISRHINMWLLSPLIIRNISISWGMGLIQPHTYSTRYTCAQVSDAPYTGPLVLCRYWFAMSGNNVCADMLCILLLIMDKDNTCWAHRDGSRPEVTFGQTLHASPKSVSLWVTHSLFCYVGDLFFWKVGDVSFLHDLHTSGIHPIDLLDWKSS